MFYTQIEDVQTDFHFTLHFECEMDRVYLMMTYLVSLLQIKKSLDESVELFFYLKFLLFVV